MKAAVYNLEFPPYVNELAVGEYTFRRVADYETAFGNMQHFVNASGSEFTTRIQTGTHQVTADVELPEREPSASLPWLDQKSTALDDILLLLSIFTGRNVFTATSDAGAIIADHRRLPFGGELCLSLPPTFMCRDKRTGRSYEREAVAGRPTGEYDHVNIGFEKGLNEVLSLVRSEPWQRKYERGHFLLLYRQAIQWQILETSFILSWTIWEHLFAVHNSAWMKRKTIEKLSGGEKIDFVRQTYFGDRGTSKLNTDELRLTRNRIVHAGKVAKPTDYKAMKRFVRETERLVAITLNLTPTYALNGD